MKAVKGDWTGILTSLPPPGETFHIYMAGLGWPATRETTGVPVSLTTPNPIAWELQCEFLPGHQVPNLLFAGLAPGMLGIYQTTFRMPSTPVGDATLTGFGCVLRSPGMAAGFGPGTPATASMEAGAGAPLPGTSRGSPAT